MRKGLYFITLITGAAIGAVAAWCYAKKKYERIAQEEIDSVKEVFAKKETDSRTQERTAEESDVGIWRVVEQAKEKSDMRQYAEILKNTGYAAGFSRKEDKTMNDIYGPYVIPPEEFGEFESYEKISLTYYADGVLADDNDEIIDDTDDIVGDALEHFGEYEDDSVFVRCDEKKCDYEILLDQRTFTEVIGNKPGRMGVR